MKQRKLNILGIIIIIVFLPILIINTTLIIKSYIKKDETPSFFGFKPFIVLSGSMEPTIKIGDIAIIKNVRKEDLKNGDIIAFRKGTSVITHRIVEVNEDEYITKGDNNNTEDRFPVQYKDIEGVFIKRIPKLGNFAMFLQTTLGAVIFISIPFILFILTDMFQKKKEKSIQIQRQKQLEKEIEELKKEKVTK